MNMIHFVVVLNIVQMIQRHPVTPQIVVLRVDRRHGTRLIRKPYLEVVLTIVRVLKKQGWVRSRCTRVYITPTCDQRGLLT